MPSDGQRPTGFDFSSSPVVAQEASRELDAARDAKARRVLIEDLRRRIHKIEGRGAAAWLPDAEVAPAHPPDRPVSPAGAEGSTLSPGMCPDPRKEPSALHPRHEIQDITLEPSAAAGAQARAGWSLGVSRLDAVLPRGGLAPDAVHEIKPVGYRDWPAAIGFALRLALRRYERLSAGGGGTDGRPILWCWPSSRAGDLGQLYGPGLVRLGIAPSDIILVETRRVSETLWVLGEALRSNAVALAVGGLEAIDLTSARRLSLVAAARATPCLLLTAPATSVAGATATRWRVEASPSGPHPLDAATPGATRFSLVLERCRGSLQALDEVAVSVEWCDVTRRFRLAARVGDRADRASHAWWPSGSGAARAG